MRKFLGFVLILIILSSLVIYGNYAVETEEITVESVRLPSNFNDTKILQISDLHNDNFLCNLSVLASEINKIKCDYIFFTGDILDSKKPSIKNLETLLDKLDNKAPKYWVNGNHENALKEQEALARLLVKNNIKTLKNDSITITKDTQSIQLLGINDPIFFDDYYKENKKFEDKLAELAIGDSYKILLSHRAEHMEIYKKNKIDLVFSGHAHGGQIRLFGKGIYSPSQGFLPKYTVGKYVEDDTTLLVSRGLGNSQIPIRFFNRPHLIVATLKSI